MANCITWTEEVKFSDTLGAAGSAACRMFAELDGVLYVGVTEGQSFGAAVFSSSDGSTWGLEKDFNDGSGDHGADWGTLASSSDMDCLFVHNDGSEDQLYGIGTDTCRLVKRNKSTGAWEQVGGTQSRLNGSSALPAFPEHAGSFDIDGTPTAFCCCRRQGQSDDSPVFEATGDLTSWSPSFTSGVTNMSGRWIIEFDGDIYLGANIGADQRVYIRDAGSGTWDGGTTLNNIGSAGVQDHAFVSDGTLFIVSRTTTPSSSHLVIHRFTSSGLVDADGEAVDTDVASAQRIGFSSSSDVFVGPGRDGDGSGDNRIFLASTGGGEGTFTTECTFNDFSSDESPSGRSLIVSSVSGEEKIYIGTSGGGEVWSADQVPICWNYTAKYKNSAKMFKLSGPGQFPKQLRIPNNVDTATGKMIDDGALIDPDRYDVC